jgi:flagellum-specific peptidoglycan hydrolase FlgJ
MPILTESEKKAQVDKWLPIWNNLLLKNGIPANKLPLVISQIILESNWFSSNAYKFDNNPGGITWNANYAKRPGASIGRKRPTREGGNYVKFDSYDSAAKDYVRILNINKGFGKPIDSTNYIQYADILKKNGYYASPQRHYEGGVKAAITRISKRFHFIFLLPMADEKS